jgi:DNA-binding IclR family transcriptional regulator
MSENLNRTLILLEHLSAAKRSGVTAAQLIEQTGLASSTVYRLVQELEALGYLRKADDRRLYPKFSFEQGMSFGGIDVGHLTAACQDICAALGVASEFITLRRETLFWHVAESHPMQSIRLRAGIGFVRGTYELDCITRMALAHLPAAEVEASWDIAGFYEVGVSGRKVPWSEARAQIEAVDTAGIQFDLMGNAKGVRRFCVAIHSDDGEFVGLLTAAEAATPLRDVEAHAAGVREVLLAAKTSVESGAKAKGPRLTHQA